MLPIDCTAPQHRFTALAKGRSRACPPADKHLKSNDPTRDLDEKAFVVDGEGRMRALTQDEKDAARKRMALPRLSWFRHRVPYKPPREPQRKSKRG